MEYSKISIITPSFNHGHFIEDAIKSVFNQGYPYFEHIIIDGGSSDNTVEILKKYNHLRWISEKDDGQSDAINKGFKISTGDIIGWLNADDYYLPDAFSTVNREMISEKADALYSNFRFIDSSGAIIRELVTQKPKKWISIYYNYIPSTTFFFKKCILENSIFIDKDFNITMDKEFFAHILHSGFRVIHVDAFFAHFRWHKNNKSLDTKEVKQMRLKEGLEIYNRYSGHHLSNDLLGMMLYRLLRRFAEFYRILCKLLKIDVYNY